jgi:cell division protein FtsB
MTRPINILLLTLLVLVQGQLWLGRGSIPEVMHLRQQLQEQKTENAKAQLENDRITAELQDLQTGMEMIEERARSEMGMVKPNEIFVQLAK